LNILEYQKIFNIIKKEKKNILLIKSKYYEIINLQNFQKYLSLKFQNHTILFQDDFSTLPLSNQINIIHNSDFIFTFDNQFNYLFSFMDKNTTLISLGSFFIRFDEKMNKHIIHIHQFEMFFQKLDFVNIKFFNNFSDIRYLGDSESYQIDFEYDSLFSFNSTGLFVYSCLEFAHELTPSQNISIQNSRLFYSPYNWCPLYFCFNFILNSTSPLCLKKIV
jgi:hypothetical protein